MNQPNMLDCDRAPGGQGALDGSLQRPLLRGGRALGLTRSGGVLMSTHPSAVEGRSQSSLP
jgi:hypothetical protein